MARRNTKSVGERHTMGVARPPKGNHYNKVVGTAPAYERTMLVHEAGDSANSIAISARSAQWDGKKKQAIDTTAQHSPESSQRSEGPFANKRC